MSGDDDEGRRTDEALAAMGVDPERARQIPANADEIRAELEAAEAAHDLATDAAELAHGTPAANDAYAAAWTAELRLYAAEDAADEGDADKHVRTRIRPIMSPVVGFPAPPGFPSGEQRAQMRVRGWSEDQTDEVLTVARRLSASHFATPSDALDALLTVTAPMPPLGVASMQRDRLASMSAVLTAMRGTDRGYLIERGGPLDDPDWSPGEIRQSLDRVLNEDAARVEAGRGLWSEASPDTDAAKKHRAKRKRRRKLAKKSKKANR